MRCVLSRVAALVCERRQSPAPNKTNLSPWTAQARARMSVDTPPRLPQWLVPPWWLQPHDHATSTSLPQHVASHHHSPPRHHQRHQVHHQLRYQAPTHARTALLTCLPTVTRKRQLLSPPAHTPAVPAWHHHPLGFPHVVLVGGHTRCGHLNPPVVQRPARACSSDHRPAQHRCGALPARCSHPRHSCHAHTP